VTVLVVLAVSVLVCVRDRIVRVLVGVGFVAPRVVVCVSVMLVVGMLVRVCRRGMGVRVRMGAVRVLMVRVVVPVIV
jgi:hypothetical protein